MREHVRIVLFRLMWIYHLQCIIDATSDDQKDYTGYAVYRLVPQNDDDLKYLQYLMEKDLTLDFWRPPTAVDREVDVMVSPDRAAFFENNLATEKIPNTILIPDVDRLIQREQLQLRKTLTREVNTFFNNYRKLHEIHRFIDQLVEKRSPRIASIISIGRSLEGNDLKAIRIGSQTSKGSKPAIWIDGGIHAREWISPATVTFIAYRLVTEYDVHKDVKELVDFFDWYILPVLNPDGYNYTHSVNRLWRKSMRPIDNICRGVDLNRNFGFHWREGGSSTDPCSYIYAGAQAFSEPETKAISDFILKNKDNFKAYLAIHSYSQLWMTPWGWTEDIPKGYDQLLAVAREGVNALEAVHGTKYEIGPSNKETYLVTGSADDWAYGVAGIKYVYTLELRDTGEKGFVLPSDQIIPTGQETWAGIKAMAKAIKKELHG